MAEQAQVSGADFTHGVADADVREGVPLLGHVGDDAVILVRDRGRVRALGATCSHYGGPLAEGAVYDGAVHCPWHHACFDLETGRAGGPAIAAVACYDVALDGGRIRVGAKREVKAAAVAAPARVVIIGGGPAAVACAEALRAEGHTGAIAMISAEGSDPVDRPNLSKDYLAGTAPEEWVFLRTKAALGELGVALHDDTATAIDTARRTVATASGVTLGYDALLVATGASARRLPIDGAELPHVHTLRTLADSRAIAGSSGPVVVIGASFIGLEAAAALRARGRDVIVVSPDRVPLDRVLGGEVGAFIRRVHEAKGVRFQLGVRPAKITRAEVVLDDGAALPAGVVVMGVGVSPRLELAAAAGLTIDRGVVVDDQLRAAPGVWAAGDIARFAWRGERVRIEHWQVAVRHGQSVARAMLGRPLRRDVPFFWSQHHDVTLGYVGHAEKLERVEVHGDLEARDAHVVYREGGAIRAVATLGRDRLALDAEAALAAGDDAALAQLVG